MKEIWKDIPDFQGYQVSNLGRVRTHNKVTYTKMHGFRKWKDRILRFKGENSINVYKTGYRVSLWKDGKPYTLLVARLVGFTFYNKDINDHSLTIDHLDGNRLNNKLDNLEIVSLGENIRRAFKNGLMPYKKVKLTNKKTNETIILDSMTKASIYLNKNHGYISGRIRKNIYEDDEYIWDLI